MFGRKRYILLQVIIFLFSKVNLAGGSANIQFKMDLKRKSSKVAKQRILNKQRQKRKNKRIKRHKNRYLRIRKKHFAKIKRPKKIFIPKKIYDFNNKKNAKQKNQKVITQIVYPASNNNQENNYKIESLKKKIDMIYDILAYNLDNPDIKYPEYDNNDLMNKIDNLPDQVSNNEIHSEISYDINLIPKRTNQLEYSNNIKNISNKKKLSNILSPRNHSMLSDMSTKSKKRTEELEILFSKTKQDIQINHFEDDSSDGNIFEKAIPEESEKHSTAHCNEANPSPNINFMNN